MKAKRVFLYLNPSDERQNRVLQYLRSSDLSASEAVTVAVTGYLKQQERRNEQEDLLRAIKGTVLDALSQRDVENEAVASDFLSFFRK